VAWIPNVNPNELVQSAWGNTIRDHVINTFATAADRDAAIPAPFDGQACYVAALDQLLVWTDKTPTASWRPPWNVAWGRVLNQVTGQMALTATAGIVPQSGFSFPVQGRRYVVGIRAGLTKANDAVGTVTLTIDRGDTHPFVSGQWSLGANFRTRAEMTVMVVSSGSDAGGLALASVDSGACTVLPGFMTLDDMGPA
jgi:hypothetical protein